MRSPPLSDVTRAAPACHFWCTHLPCPPFGAARTNVRAINVHLDELVIHTSVDQNAGGVVSGRMVATGTIRMHAFRMYFGECVEHVHAGTRIKAPRPLLRTKLTACGNIATRHRILLLRSHEGDTHAHLFPYVITPARVGIDSSQTSLFMGGLLRWLYTQTRDVTHRTEW